MAGFARISSHAGPPSRFPIVRTIGKGLEHPWNKTLSLWGDFQQLPGIKAIESSGILERAMGIEPTSEVWDLLNPLLVGRLRSCGQGVGEGVAKRHGQDGSFGALQPPAINRLVSRDCRKSVVHTAVHNSDV